MEKASRRILRLDGLRAVAIIAVLLHHHSIVRGGWVGVDLFFVLSGYLITGILRRDRERSHFWWNFYIKRVTRILPPVLLLIALIWFHYRPPVRSILAYVFFLGNFASTSERTVVPWLIMLWSLAVEEHFYFVFPFAVRYLKRATLLKVLFGVIAIEPVLRYFATSRVHVYTQIYFWTPFRLDGLAWGALLALCLEDERATVWITRWSGMLALATAAIFAAASFWLPVRFDRESNTHLFNTFGYSLLSLTFVSAIAYTLLRPAAISSKLLGWRPLVFIGTISYGLYLYHQSVRVMMLHLMAVGPRRVFAVSVPMAIVLSSLSFFYYEKPFIALGHRKTR